MLAHHFLNLLDILRLDNLFHIYIRYRFNVVQVDVGVEYEIINEWCLFVFHGSNPEIDN